jgi:hypothetical protein
MFHNTVLSTQGRWRVSNDSDHYWRSWIQNKNNKINNYENDENIQRSRNANLILIMSHIPKVVREANLIKWKRRPQVQVLKKCKAFEINVMEKRQVMPQPLSSIQKEPLANSWRICLFQEYISNRYILWKEAGPQPGVTWVEINVEEQLEINQGLDTKM